MSKFRVTTTIKTKKVDPDPEIIIPCIYDFIIDKHIYLVESDYNMVLWSIDKVIDGINKNAYRIIEIGSKETIDHLDKFILSSRRLRKELRKLGFVKLRNMNRFMEITGLYDKTEHIVNRLVYLKDVYYPIIANSIFFTQAVRGEIILNKYIKTFGILVTATEKWIGKFFGRN